MMVFLGLCIGNFLAQFFADQIWIDAIERSFFQGGAIFAYWIFGGAK